MAKDSSSKSSITNTLFGLVSIGAGAYHGYCDGNGIPLEKENLEWLLTYGPAIVGGSIGAISCGILGLVGGGAVGANLGLNDSVLERIAKGTGGAIAGTVAAAGLGGAVGGLYGGIPTLIGYGAGYLVGHIIK